jgi:hypothetical protein
MDAVGTDHDVRVDLEVGEHGYRPISCLPCPEEPATKVQVLASHPLDEGVEEQLLEHAAMGRDLGVRISRREASRLTPNLLASVRTVQKDFRFDGLLAELVEQPECIEFPHCMWQEVDAHPEGTQFFGRLEDVDVHAYLMQA